MFKLAFAQGLRMSTIIVSTLRCPKFWNQHYMYNYIFTIQSVARCLRNIGLGVWSMKHRIKWSRTGNVNDFIISVIRFNFGPKFFLNFFLPWLLIIKKKQNWKCQTRRAPRLPQSSYGPEICALIPKVGIRNTFWICFPNVMRRPSQSVWW